MTPEESRTWAIALGKSTLSSEDHERLLDEILAKPLGQMSDWARRLYASAHRVYATRFQA